MRQIGKHELGLDHLAGFRQRRLGVAMLAGDDSGLRASARYSSISCAVPRFSAPDSSQVTRSACRPFSAGHMPWA